MEVVANDLRLSLAAIKVTAHTGNHLGAVTRTIFSEGVRFHILIDNPVGIRLGAVARHANQTQLLRARFDRLFGENRAVRRVAVDDQIDLSGGLSRCMNFTNRWLSNLP